jgi:hypothetical protein
MRGGVGSFVANAKAIDRGTDTLRRADSARFQMNTIVLDFTGGAGSAQPTAPAHILLRGPDGKLHVRSQAGDARHYDLYQQLLHPDTNL